MLDRLVAFRDLAFQSTADRLDARFGLHCFRLARLALFLYCAGLATLFAILLSLGDDPHVAGALAMLPLGVPMLVAKLVALVRLSVFERRVSGGTGTVVIPSAASRPFVGLFVAFFTIAAAFALAATLRGGAAIVTGHGAPGGAALVATWVVAFCCMCLQPAAVLFAGCEWRRLHRPRRRIGAPCPSPA